MRVKDVSLGDAFFAFIGSKISLSKRDFGNYYLSVIFVIAFHFPMVLLSFLFSHVGNCYLI